MHFITTKQSLIIIAVALAEKVYDRPLPGRDLRRSRGWANRKPDPTNRGPSTNRYFCIPFSYVHAWFLISNTVNNMINYIYRYSVNHSIDPKTYAVSHGTHLATCHSWAPGVPAAKSDGARCTDHLCLSVCLSLSLSLSG